MLEPPPPVELKVPPEKVSPEPIVTVFTWLVAPLSPYNMPEGVVVPVPPCTVIYVERA